MIPQYDPWDWFVYTQAYLLLGGGICLFCYFVLKFAIGMGRLFLAIRNYRRYQNACHDKHGNQWTSLHMKMEALFCLGMGLGIVKYYLPREMWGAFPGGMPYLEIDLVRDEAVQ